MTSEMLDEMERDAFRLEAEAAALEAECMRHEAHEGEMEMDEKTMNDLINKLVEAREVAEKAGDVKLAEYMSRAVSRCRRELKASQKTEAQKK